MLLLLLLYLVTLLALLIIGLVIYARWNFGTLEKQGIPVVEPSDFLLGSAMLTYQKPGGYVDIENMKKYGPIFGLYEGREPQIFICDADLIRKITTKDADYFDGKRPLDFGDPLFDEMLDFQPKEKWRMMRSMMTPSVSTPSRLRDYNAGMRDAIRDFIDDIKQQIKESPKGRLEKYCVKEGIFGMLTDLLARSLYSVRMGKLDKNHRLVQIVRILMTPPGNESPWIASYAYAFPFIKKFLPNVMINPEPSNEFANVIKQMMEMRRNQRASSEGPPYKDYLDSLIEWYDNLGSEEYKKAGITESTVFNLGLTLFIAGQDQISLLLGAMFKHLSENPEMEQRVQKEVDSVFQKFNGVLENEALSEFPYLNACITEATRLYPFFFRTERVCTKDWEDTERGIQIKKGNVVQIAIWATNRNPEYFEEPEEFNPDRFLPGNRENIHPYAFTSFGFGPRNCLGKRIAIEMMTLVAAHMLRELRFIKRDDTQLTFVPAGPFFGASEPIYFDVEARN